LYGTSKKEKTQMTKMQKAIAELNRIAALELGPRRTGPKRHQHMWTSGNKLKRGETITFHCAIEGCDKTKQKFFPLLEGGPK
jgi:hypothetical protein